MLKFVDRAEIEDLPVIGQNRRHEYMEESLDRAINEGRGI